ncbi:MAG TPA: hypothetical protein PLU58_00620 [Saprospiraceae bacterium]|nr:hypothetical protein [Saprospiraceae bacterium]
MFVFSCKSGWLQGIDNRRTSEQPKSNFGWAGECAVSAEENYAWGRERLRLITCTPTMTRLMTGEDRYMTRSMTINQKQTVS